MQVVSGGVAAADPGAAFAAPFVSSGHTTTITVTSGETLQSQTIGANTELLVESGGVVSAMVIAAGGVEDIQSGGASFDDVVSGGGREELDLGAVANLGHVLSGGLAAGPGVLAAPEIAGVVNGCVLNALSSGGSLFLITLDSGASLVDVTLAGETFGFGPLTVTGGVVVGQDDFLDGVASGLEVAAGGVLGMSGSVTSAILEGALNLTGGLASGTTISAGGDLLIQTAVDSATMVLSGGTEAIANGGESDGALIFGGGTQSVGGFVQSGGLASGAILSGGVQIVRSDGTVVDTQVLSGGVLSLAGGSATSSFVFAGGTLVLPFLVVSADLTFSSAFTSATFSGVTIAGGRLQTSQTVVTSAVLTIDAGVSLGGSEFIAAGGVIALLSGASVDGVTVALGGALTGRGVLAGETGNIDAGLVSGVTLGAADAPEATLTVEAGGVASKVIELGLGDLLRVSSGGRAVKIEGLASLDQIAVESGGVAVSSLLRAGAAELVFGSATGAHISSGGIEDVASGGLARDADVMSGGVQTVFSGAVASSTRVLAGGEVVISAGGRARQANVGAGGTLVVSGAATWAGAGAFSVAGVLSGAGELVQAGPGVLSLGGVEGGYRGEVVISGGAVDLVAAGALAAARIDFAVAGAHETVRIAAADRPATGGGFAPALTDFDSTATFIDLAGLAFVSGARATLSGGTLLLHDGAYSATFSLNGAGASKYSVLDDGSGGTEIRAAAGSTIAPLVAHAAAAFGGAGAAAFAASSPGLVRLPSLFAAPAHRAS